MDSLIEPFTDGPRERLALHGRSALSNAELTAILLGTGANGIPVLVAATRLLEFAGGIHGLSRMSVDELCTQSSIGMTKACRLLAAIELGTRLFTQPLERARPISSSRDVAAALQARFVHEEREHFIVIALDAKNRPVAELTVAIGGVIACAVLPADVFRPVLRAAGVSALFVHNHPSGDPTPSEEDVTITGRLCRAGEMLGIQVLDHIILGRDNYFSFLDAGLMTQLSQTEGHAGSRRP